MKFVDKLTFNNNTYELKDSTARDILTQQGENIAEIDGKQQVMRSEINSLQTRMGEAEQDILNNSTSISDIEDTIDIMDNDIDSNTGRITALEARVDECEDVNTAQQVEINNIKNRVTTAEGNINVINGNISDINSSIDAIAAVDTQQTAQINQNKADITTLKNRANAADSRMDAMDTRMDGIDTTIADLDDRIVASTYEAGEGIYFGQGKEHTNINVEDELLDEIHQDTQDIADLKNRVKNLENRVDDIEDDIDNIQQDITDIRGDITDIRGDITDIRGDITTINNNITTINNNITTIQQDIISIQSDISDIQSDMADYQSDINALKSRVTACETNIGYALTLIDGLTSRVALLEEGIDPNYIVFDLLPTDPFTLRSQDSVSLLHSYADKIVDSGSGYDKSILGRITDGHGYLYDMPLLSYDNDNGLENDNHAGTFIFFIMRNNKYYYIRLYYDDTRGAEVKTVTIDEATTDLSPIQTQIDTINTDIDVITLNINDISNNVAGLQGDVTVIQGDVTNIIGDITTLQNDVNYAQGDISNLQSDVTDIQSDITDIDNKITPNVIECTVVNASTCELTTTLTSDQLLDMADDYKTKNKPIHMHIAPDTTGTIGDITEEAIEVTLKQDVSGNSGTIFFEMQWKYSPTQFATNITNYLVKFEFKQNSPVTITSTSTSEFENTFRMNNGHLESQSEIKRIYDTVINTPVDDRHSNKWLCQVVVDEIFDPVYQWVYPTIVKDGTNVFIYVKYYQDVRQYKYYSAKIDSSYNVTYNELYDGNSYRFSYANQMSHRCRVITESGPSINSLLQRAGTFNYSYTDSNKPSWFPSDLSGGTYTGVIVINSNDGTMDSDSGAKYIELYDYYHPDTIYRMVRPSNNSTIGPWYKFTGTVVT